MPINRLPSRIFRHARRGDHAREPVARGPHSPRGLMAAASAACGHEGDHRHMRGGAARARAAANLTRPGAAHRLGREAIRPFMPATKSGLFGKSLCQACPILVAGTFAPTPASTVAVDILVKEEVA